MGRQTLDTSFEYEAIPEELTVDEVATFEFHEQAVEILGEQ